MFFQFLHSILHDLRKFLVLWIDEMNTSELSDILELWSFTCPILFFFHLEFLGILLQISGPDVACRFVRLSPDDMYPSGSFSLIKENYMKPVHESDESLDSSMFQ